MRQIQHRLEAMTLEKIHEACIGKEEDAIEHEISHSDNLINSFAEINWKDPFPAPIPEKVPNAKKVPR